MQKYELQPTLHSYQITQENSRNMHKLYEETRCKRQGQSNVKTKMCTVSWKLRANYRGCKLKVCYRNDNGSYLIIKPNRWTNFSNLFWNGTLHVSDSSSVRHQELFTVHSAMVYVIQVCRQLSSRIRMELQFHPDPEFHSDPDRKLSVWRIPLLSLQWITPDDGERNCPKHVEFHFKTNLRN
jgi:hypothetical protein